MTEDEDRPDDAARYGVLSPEDSERLRLLREEAQRTHEQKWGPTDPDAEVNVRKWSDPVDLRVVRPAPEQTDEEHDP